MKKMFLAAERFILNLWPVRMAVIGVSVFLFRLKWAWGRIKFGATVKNKGHGCVCAYDAEIKYPENLYLGDRVVIGNGVTIGARSPIRLGNDVRLSKDVIIETAGLMFDEQIAPYKHTSQPIVIEDGVWIGARAILLGGITVGANSIIAAGSVVAKTVPPETIVAGVPGKQIRTKE